MAITVILSNGTIKNECLNFLFLEDIGGDSTESHPYNTAFSSYQHIAKHCQLPHDELIAILFVLNIVLDNVLLC